MCAAKFESPVDRLIYWASVKPDGVFLTQPINDQTYEYTWSQVLDEVSRVAQYLARYPQGSHIGIISLNCAHWFMADLAIQMAGHVSIPIYPTASTDTVNKILVHAEVKAVFIGKMFSVKKALSHLQTAIKDQPIEQLAIYESYPGIPFWQQLVDGNQAIELPAQHQINDLLSIIYTSGTTGDPKGVMISYRAVQAAINLVKSVIVINDKDRFVSYLPLAHVAERMAVEFGSLYHGSHVSFIRSLETFTDDIKAAEPTVFFAVPRIWVKIKAAIETKLGGARTLKILFSIPWLGQCFKQALLRKLGFQNIRYALCAAAPVNKEVLHWFSDLGLKLNEAYGMSETCGLSHMTQQSDAKMGSVGRVIDGCDCRLTAAGEVLLRNPAMMDGYYKQQELTAETIDTDGWLHTGDLGEIDDEGFLYITGRNKDIFKTAKGKYISPSPIEQQFHTALGVPHLILMGNGFPQPFMVISTHESALVNEPQKLMQICQEQLSKLNLKLEAHERLSHIFISHQNWGVDNGMLTPTLKMKRDAIEKFYLSQAEQLMSSSSESVLLIH